MRPSRIQEKEKNRLGKQLSFSVLQGLRNERGAALLTALYMAALVSIMAVSMLSRQQVDIRRTANILHTDQALLLAEGMEDWACRLLGRSTAEEELMMKQAGLPPLEAEGALLGGRLEDVQGLFNVNNLVLGDQDRQAFCRAQFGRLLESCGMEQELVGAVVDWLDRDGELSFPGGAEDSAYLAQDPPALAANAAMVSATELALVAGFDRPEYRNCLASLVCALPEPTDLDINSAPARVLASLSARLDTTAGEAIVQARPLKGFQTVQEFLQLGVLAGTGLQDRYLDVHGSYFVVQSVAELEHSRMVLNSLLKRSGREVRVVRRSQGPL